MGNLPGDSEPFLTVLVVLVEIGALNEALVNCVRFFTFGAERERFPV